MLTNILEQFLRDVEKSPFENWSRMVWIPQMTGWLIVDVLQTEIDRLTPTGFINAIKLYRYLFRTIVRTSKFRMFIDRIELCPCRFPPTLWTVFSGRSPPARWCFEDSIVNNAQSGGTKLTRIDEIALNVPNVKKQTWMHVLNIKQTPSMEMV